MAGPDHLPVRGHAGPCAHRCRRQNRPAHAPSPRDRGGGVGALGRRAHARRCLCGRAAAPVRLRAGAGVAQLAGHPAPAQARCPQAPWHFLYLLPEPHGHGSLRPTLSAATSPAPWRCAAAAAAAAGEPTEGPPPIVPVREGPPTVYAEAPCAGAAPAEVAEEL